MKKKILMECDDLTIKAKSIFGEYVDKGYLSINVYEDDNEEEREKILKNFGVRGFNQDNKDETGIVFEDDYIFIKFKNGNMINFITSEYGFLKNTKDITYEIDYIDK